MSETQSLITEVIKLVPYNSICFIQAPDIESTLYHNLVTASPFDYYQQITFTDGNKELLIKAIIEDDLEESFQGIEIRLNNKLLFEGYDGLEYARISREVPLTYMFQTMFIDTELCLISKEW